MNIITFLILLLPPMLYSVGNILDKKLVSKGVDSAPLVIVTISSIFSFLAIPMIYFFAGIDRDVSLPSILIMMFSGILTTLSVLLYLKALEKNSVLAIVPAMQLAPALSYILGIIFLGEFITYLSLLGCIIIIILSTLLTIKIEKSSNKNTFDYSVFFMTLLSSLCLSISGVLFKYFALNYDYWSVQYYEYLGIMFFGLCVLFFNSSVRINIRDVFLSNRYKNFAPLNFFTEIIMVSGDLALNYSVLVAPVAVAFSFNSIQPVFLILLIFIINKTFNFFKNTEYSEKITLKTTIITLIIILCAILVYSGSGIN